MVPMQRVGRLILAAWAALLLAAPALAQSTPKTLGEYRAWTALQYKERGDDVCFMSSSPEKWTSDPKGVNRGDIYMLVTHRPGAKIRDEVSVYAGYPYEEDSEVTVDIDGQQFKLFTDQDTAWAYDADSDRKLVQAMVRGNTMVIRGTSSRGSLTIDTYSLSGFTAARDAINKACRIR
jgi:hypothetical protein